jgi:PAS domain S-box-containing protein
MRHPAAESSHVAEVESSAGFLSSLVENLPDMVFVKDALELKFVRLNRAAEELLGFSRRELLGKSDFDFFPRSEAEFFTAKDRAVLAGGNLLDIPEEPIHTRCMGVRILHTKKIPILATNGTPLYLLGISEDITEKKLAEEERDRSRSRVSLLEAERTLREQFVSTLSHDLRTPLATILAAAQLLLRHPEQRELLSTLPQRIIRSASRADRMIQDLLDVTRIAAGNPLPLKIVATDLAAMAAEIVTETRGLHPNPISLDVEGPLDGYWSADELGRAIENLLSNAVKHGAPGGAITLAVRPAGAAVKIRVHNVGNPIPPDDLTTIFEPFRRSGCVEQKGTKGWGLGLTLVRAIAEAHGGHVSVESSATEGTRFELVVLRDARPLQQATEPPPAPAVASEMVKR